MAILPRYVTVTGLALTAALPTTTAIRRLQKRGVIPDAILARGAENPAELYRADRISEIVAILKGPSELAQEAGR